MVGAQTVQLTLDGHTYYLFCSCDAFVRLEQEVDKDIFEATRSDPEKLLLAAEILSEAGELLRRDYHYTPAEWLHVTDYPRHALTPWHRRTIQQAVTNCLLAGLAHEVPQEAEVDLYLLEDQKKTGAAGPVTS